MSFNSLYTLSNVYIAAYALLCGGLIVILLVTLHRAGDIFLRESFPDRPEVMRAVRNLLDIGFYLVSFGYVILTFQTSFPIDSFARMTEILSIKVGLFLLLMGALHFFNLLLLALFRRRGAPSSTAPATA